MNNLKNKLKEDKAITLIDVIMGLAILLLFTGILTSGFYQIYKYNASIRLDAIVVNYSISILEDIDKLSYDEVTEDLNENINERYEIPEEYKIELDVEKYNKDHVEREDLIKIVTLNIEYQGLDGIKTNTVRKLKIREF